MGGYESPLLGGLEPSVRDHSGGARILMVFLETGRLTVSGGQFDWGGHLNCGAHRQQCKWKASGYMLEPPFSKLEAHVTALS